MYWYQWFFGTSLAKERLESERAAFTWYIWSIWITGLNDWQDTFETTVRSFGNPDWVAVTLHSYQVRWKLDDKDPRYDPIEQQIENDLMIAVPTLVLRGSGDPVAVAKMYEGKEDLFKNGYQLRVIADSGHFSQREKPGEVSDALIAFLN